MKSSSGNYYIGLDHVRALAAFLVFSTHFVQVGGGHYMPPPIFPLSFLTEGQTGVALFMTLSGYLFAKLLEGKSIRYPAFFWNRFIRLAPLLAIVTVLTGIQAAFRGADMAAYWKAVAQGFVMPTWPNGGWSIATEFHFYLLLPILLLICRKDPKNLLYVVAGSIVLRAVFWALLGEVQGLSYWTIVGRIDQFVFGILGYHFRALFVGRHRRAMVVLLAFTGFYYYYDLLGGFYLNPSYPSPHSLWIYMPAVEGVSYAALIAWYDGSFKHSEGRISKAIALIGTCSYSIYLFHFFIVYRLSTRIHENVVDLSNIYVAFALLPFAFLLMVPVGYASFRWLEKPFLRFRTRYTDKKEPDVPPVSGSGLTPVVKPGE